MLLDREDAQPDEVIRSISAMRVCPQCGRQRGFRRITITCTRPTKESGRPVVTADAVHCALCGYAERTV